MTKIKIGKGQQEKETRKVILIHAQKGEKVNVNLFQLPKE